MSQIVFIEKNKTPCKWDHPRESRNSHDCALEGGELLHGEVKRYQVKGFGVLARTEHVVLIECLVTK